MRGGHAAVLAMTGIAACGGGDVTPTPPSPDPFAAPAACSSGVTRDPNESESPLMMPGHACNACHADVAASTGEAAPLFRFAGTVYPTAHEPDDCVGAAAYRAQVWVTDANGVIQSATINRSGNFSLEASFPAFVPPYEAEVRFEGRERHMLTPQMEGDCNSCHTEAGANGAPGRIVLP
jgi:hypothetical protein